MNCLAKFVMCTYDVPGWVVRLFSKTSLRDWELATQYHVYHTLGHWKIKEVFSMYLLKRGYLYTDYRCYKLYEYCELVITLEGKRFQ